MVNVTTPPALDSLEYKMWCQAIHAYYFVTNCEPGRGLQAVCEASYDVVSGCVCIVAQSDEASFKSGWLKALWDVFISPEWRKPRLWSEGGRGVEEPEGASDDYILGFFLGIVKEPTGRHPRFQEELLDILPQAIVRLNSSRSLVRYTGCGRFAEVDNTGWKDWMKATEEGIKSLANHLSFYSRNKWFEIAREVIRLIPPTWPRWGKGRTVAPDLSDPAKHVIGCLRWATDKMYEDYFGLYTLAHSGLNPTRTPLVI